MPEKVVFKKTKILKQKALSMTRKHSFINYYSVRFSVKVLGTNEVSSRKYRNLSFKNPSM